MADGEFDWGEFDAWLTPLDAVSALEGRYTKIVAIQMMFIRLQGGALDAFARDFYTAPLPASNPLPYAVSVEIWQAIAAQHGANFHVARFWVSGDFTLTVPGNGDRLTMDFHYLGVRFDPVIIDQMARGLARPSPQQTVRTEDTAPPTAPNLGGRPRADWWDNLWIEMCRQIYNGNLKFDRIADIERAMHDFLATIDRSASEATLKRAARKLHAVLQKEVQN
jgi:hypothetical protein